MNIGIKYLFCEQQTKLDARNCEKSPKNRRHLEMGGK